MIKEGGMPSLLSPSSVTWFVLVQHHRHSLLVVTIAKANTINTGAKVNPNNIQNKLRVDGWKDIDQDGDSEDEEHDRNVRDMIQWRNMV